MLAEHDQLGASHGLGAIQFLQQRIGRRTTGATLGGEQFHQNRGRAFLTRRIARSYKQPSRKDQDK